MKYNFNIVIRNPNDIKRHADKRRGRIAKTPFKVHNRYPNAPECDVEDFITGDYVYVNCKELMRLSPKLNPTSIKLMLFIATKLDNNSNIAKCNMVEFNRLFSTCINHKLNFYLYPLLLNGIIIRTNRKCKYIVNHNLFFKGNLNQFVKDYKELYGDSKCEYNEDGDVIID